MLTTGVTPALHVDYKHYRIKQYHKENRALRTETTTPALASGASVNDARDLYLGKGLHNLSALRQVGFQANRRLLRVQTLSYDPRLGEAAFQAVQQPVVVGAQRAAELSLPGERLLVSASHRHSTPTARPLRQWGQVDQAYQLFLEAAILGAVKQARGVAVEARLGYGLGQAATISANRRGLDGPIDPAVPVLVFHRRDATPAEWNADEEPPTETAVGPRLAVLYNFACHPVSLHSYRNLLSPDYVGYTRAALQALLADDPVSLFTLGACGDINPARFYFRRTTPRQAQRVGAVLGCEVAQVALDPQLVEQPTLRLKSVVVDLPLAPLPAPAELERHQRDFAQQTAEALAAGKPLVEASVLEIQRDWAADALAVAYDCSLMSDEHTGGMDVPIGPAHEACWDQKGEFAYRAAALAHDVLSKSANALADQVRLADEGYHIVVFNPLAFARSAVVRALAVPPPPNGRPLRATAWAARAARRRSRSTPGSSALTWRPGSSKMPRPCWSCIWPSPST